MWFATIRGSGHFVPHYRPIEAKSLVDYFLGHIHPEEQLPPYIPPGTTAKYWREKAMQARAQELATDP